MLLRALFATAILTTALTAAGISQSRDRSFGRSGNSSCADYGSSDRASYCEVREETIGGANPLDINAGRNGGIRVRGWDRGQHDSCASNRIACAASRYWEEQVDS